MTYGIGIVGLGMISAFHAKAIAEMKNAKLVACFSRSEEKAKAFSDQHGGKPYSNYEDFLADPDLHIVSITTPSGYHRDPAVAAAKAGKQLLCEKPIEITLQRARAIIDACNENGVQLSGIFPRRFMPAAEEIKKAVEAGRLGKMTLASAYIKWFRSQDYYQSDAWRRTWKGSGGGALMNQGIHFIDMLLHFAGDVESVSAYADTATHEGLELEDVAVATLKFKSGAIGTIEGTTTAYSKTGHPAQVQLCGSKGSIFLSDDTITAWDFEESDPRDEEIIARFGADSAATAAGAADPSSIDYREHQKNFEDFLDCLENGTTPHIDGNEALRSIELILAIYESALNGGKQVKLPLAKDPEFRPLR